MKSFIPWLCLATVTVNSMSYANKTLETYRMGNYSLAAETLPNQANQDPIALYYLGRMHLYGYGELKNNATALHYFENAGEKGVLPAQQLLAGYYLIHVKAPETALYWFKKAASNNDLNAQLYCAAAYLFGYGAKPNEDIARRYFIDAAKRGNPIAQYALSEHFLDSGSSSNNKLGVIWLMKSAQQGNPKAQYRLAKLYGKGRLVDEDKVEEMKLLNASAAQGYLPAMRQLGELALEQNDVERAKTWLNKAAIGNHARAQWLLARLFLEHKNTFYNPNTGFMWMLQAAQNGSLSAQEELVSMYEKGVGVQADPSLAQQWKEKAKQTETQDEKINPAIEVSKWLSNDKVSNFDIDGFRLGGIYTTWRNPVALKENKDNVPPQMQLVTRQELFNPKFVMISPKDISIGDYFDMIASALNPHEPISFLFQRYPLDPQIEALQKHESLVLAHSPRESMVDEGLPYVTTPEDEQPVDYFSSITQGWQHKANLQLALSEMYNKAILGESAAQFELGQLYHYGVVVAKNIEQALTYYQLAAMQQDVRAEYNLGLLYLEGKTNPVDYQQGIHWLTDAAFKGNVYAQYALANIYENGFKDASGALVVQPNAQEALSMYYLASSNHYGPAEYRLAELLVKENNKDLSVLAKQNRTKLIKRLYEEAEQEGIVEAKLPLAFYYAMDSDLKKQQRAFSIANDEAKKENGYGALLLGMMVERGISVPADDTEALRWYQLSGDNPVSAFVLGTYYTQGIGVTKDLEKGRSLLNKAADVGFSYAHLNRAILKHDTNEVFVDDLDKARELGNAMSGLLLADYYLSLSNDLEKINQAKAIYQYFAEKGDKDAQLKLAFLYDEGLIGETDRGLAQKWYTASAEQNQPVAQYLLGLFYQLGKDGSAPDYALAKKWYSAAKSDYPRAATTLGFLYDTVDDDYKNALDNYQLAADKGDKLALFNEGLIYEYGKGVPFDYSKAKLYYDKAADLGHPQAMTQLAGLYFSGAMGERDEQKAFNGYRKSAELGNSDALYQLGLLSETGILLKLDYSEAIRHYQAAAEKGNEKAKMALARMYQYGLGVDKNVQMASQLYEQLAVNNNAYAQYQLALLHLEGINGVKKVDDARRLLKLASQHGSQQARLMLNWMEAKQTQSLSFIEPIRMPVKFKIEQQPADFMYFNALNEWNSGDETQTHSILGEILNQFPEYLPAKRAYEELNQRVLSQLPT